MYNSSFQSNKSETLNWYLRCKGHLGANVIFIVSALCFIVGTPTHCWSLWVYLRGNIKPNLVFRLNITILELLFCFQCIVDVYATFYPSQGLGIYLFFMGLGWTCRPIIQICICVEQYLAVIHPVTFLRNKSIYYRTGYAGAAWLIALGNSLRLTIIGIDNFPDHVFMFLFCIALIIVIFCCISVLHGLKRPRPGEQKNERTEKDRCNKMYRGKTGEKNKHKRKAFRIISHILVSILTCYISLVITYFMNIAKIDVNICDTVPLILSFTIIAVLISSVVSVYREGHFQHIMFFKH